MTPNQVIGWSLNQTSAVTAYTSTRIYFGTRPVGTTTPCINYFRMAGSNRYNGVEVATFAINCRASTPQTAVDLAREVVNLFAGTEGRGVYGTQNGFDIARASLRNDNGVIFEPEDEIYNAPVDITTVYTVDTVS